MFRQFLKFKNIFPVSDVNMDIYLFNVLQGENRR